QLQSTLEKTESSLIEVRNKANIVSVDETKKGYSEEISKIRLELVSLEAEFAERKEIVNQAKKANPENSAAATDLGGPSIDVINRYRRACQQLDYLRKQENSLVEKGYADENPRLKDTRSQMAEAEKAQQEILGQFPKLATLL